MTKKNTMTKMTNKFHGFSEDFLFARLDANVRVIEDEDGKSWEVDPGMQDAFEANMVEEGFSYEELDKLLSKWMKDRGIPAHRIYQKM